MNVTVGKDTITVQVLPKDKSPDDLILSKVKAAKKEDETTFYMMDVDRLLKLHQDWVEAMPSVAPFYAVKVNPDPLLLKTLIALGCGFDCASKGEIKTILDLGGSPEKIMYSNPIKMLSHIQYAAENNVRMMTFDSEPELPRIKSYFPTAQLVLRIKADDPTNIWPVGEKYGCTLPEAYKLLETAKELGLDVIGVSFYVGWRCGPSAYEMALEISAKVFQYAEKLGYHFTLVDVGGGFSCCTTPADIDQFQKQATSVNKGLQQYFAGYPNLKAIGEPGTYFCCSTHSLVVRVIGKKKTANPNPDAVSFMYYITDGVYGSFNMVLHGQPPRVPPVVIREHQSSSADQCFKSTIWGPSLDSHDKVFDAISLPEVEVGEWLCIKSMGAYSEAIASRFNAMPVHENYYCVSEAKSKLLKELGLSS